jgi:hypothetical protein
MELQGLKLVPPKYKIISNQNNAPQEGDLTLENPSLRAPAGRSQPNEIK